MLVSRQRFEPGTLRIRSRSLDYDDWYKCRENVTLAQNTKNINEHPGCTGSGSFGITAAPTVTPSPKMCSWVWDAEGVVCYGYVGSRKPGGVKRLQTMYDLFLLAYFRA
jgi:hypothetical protein